MKNNVKLIIPLVLIVLFLMIGSIYAYKFYSKPMGESIHCYYYFDGARTDDYYYLEDGYLKSVYHVLNLTYPVEEDSMYRITEKMNNDYKWQLYNMAQNGEKATETSYFQYDMIKNVDPMDLNPSIKRDEGKKLTKEDFKVAYDYIGDGKKDGKMKYHCDWNAF